MRWDCRGISYRVYIPVICTTVLAYSLIFPCIPLDCHDCGVNICLTASFIHHDIGEESNLSFDCSHPRLHRFTHTLRILSGHYGFNQPISFTYPFVFVLILNSFVVVLQDSHQVCQVKLFIRITSYFFQSFSLPVFQDIEVLLTYFPIQLLVHRIGKCSHLNQI